MLGFPRVMSMFRSKLEKTMFLLFFTIIGDKLKVWLFFCVFDRILFKIDVFSYNSQFFMTIC